MDLNKQLLQDFKKYLINKQKIKKDTIQVLRADLLNKEKKIQRVLSTDEILEVILKEIKQKENVLESFLKANRKDLYDQTIEEIETLKIYIPKQLNKEELKQEMIKIKETLEISSSKDIGKLIQFTKKQFGFMANGKDIFEIAKEILS